MRFRRDPVQSSWHTALTFDSLVQRSRAGQWSEALIAAAQPASG